MARDAYREGLKNDLGEVIDLLDLADIQKRFAAALLKGRPRGLIMAVSEGLLPLGGEDRPSAGVRGGGSGGHDTQGPSPNAPPRTSRRSAPAVPVPGSAPAKP